MNDIGWMREAIKEATKGGWTVHPNPMVGAVIVKDGVELGRGYHHGVGTSHAEVEALEDASRRGYDVRGATIYVTLEPCNHYGHTPPCTEALISAGISRCVIGATDSNRKVKGGGIERLQSEGIECVQGVCEDEVREFNAPFFTRTMKNRPYITCKWAMTADGRTASATGSSQWITGPESRRDVHLERSKHDAIIAGTQTIIADNPQLNVRLDNYSGRQPVRIVLDRTLRIPHDYHVFDTANQKSILFTSVKDADFSFYKSRNIDVHIIDESSNHLDILKVLNILADQYNITTLYCEGGAGLHGSLHDQQLIDQVHIYIGAKLIGGMNAAGCIGGRGIELMNQATELKIRDIRQIGNDIRLCAGIEGVAAYARRQ